MVKRSKRSRFSCSASALRKLLSPAPKSKDVAVSKADCKADNHVRRGHPELKSLNRNKNSAMTLETDRRRSSCKSDNARRSSLSTRLSFGAARRRSSCKSIASSSSNAAPVMKVSMFMRLITKGDWDAVRNYLSTETGAFCAAAEMTTTDDTSRNSEDVSFDNDSGVMAIHMAMRQHPPLDIVASLMRFNPLLTAQLDTFGRTPLHVAAANGASPQVIRFMLQQDVGAAAKLDCEGKTPLHLCCEHCCSEEKCDPGLGKGVLVKGPMSEVLKMLAKAFPDSLNREDEMEMSPLEHAIVNGADVKVVKLLQKLSVIEWRKIAMEEPDFFGEHLDFSQVAPIADVPPPTTSLRVPVLTPQGNATMSETSSISDDMSLELPVMKEVSFPPKLNKRMPSPATRCSVVRGSSLDAAGVSSKSLPVFCEASLLKAIIKAGSDGSSEKDARSVASLYKQLNNSVNGQRVTAARSGHRLRRRSSCNAAA